MTVHFAAPAALSALLAAALPVSAAAEVQVLLFPDAALARQSGADATVKFDPGIGLFATGRHGAFIWLGEAFVSRDEREIERAQVGWRLDPRNTLWIGRMHTPIGYWNTEYHHGTYLYTSHSPPAIDDFEDEGSPLPKHFVGLMWEGSAASANGGAWRYSAAWGAQPRWGDGVLEAQNILKPNKFGRHANGGGMRVVFRPDEVSTDEWGVSFHAGTALGDSAPISKIAQRVIAAHAVKNIGNSKWTGTLMRVASEVVSRSRSSGAFLSLWVQGEYSFSKAYTGYVRSERSTHGSTDPLLTLVPSFPRQKDVLGLRWDFYTRQALRIELENARTLEAKNRSLAVTWSAVFP